MSVELLTAVEGYMGILGERAKGIELTYGEDDPIAKAYRLACSELWVIIDTVKKENLREFYNHKP